MPYEECCTCHNPIHLSTAKIGPFNELYCQKCMDTRIHACDCCNQPLPLNKALTTPEGYAYCQPCFVKSFFTCDYCGDAFHTNALYHASDEGEFFCELCCEDD